MCLVFPTSLLMELFTLIRELFACAPAADAVASQRILDSKEKKHVRPDCGYDWLKLSQMPGSLQMNQHVIVAVVVGVYLRYLQYGCRHFSLAFVPHF